MASLASQDCLKKGITSFQDAGTPFEILDLLKSMVEDGSVGIRLWMMVAGSNEDLAKNLPKYMVKGAAGGRFSVGGIKRYMDGALGSRGALLLAPYADEPGKTGLATIEPDRLKAVLQRALAQGFQVATHAIGDAANRMVLDAYEAAFGAAGGARRRFRVEHAQVLAPADVPRFKALGVIPSMQPTHCTSDMYWAADRVGPERAQGAYLWKTFLKQGVPLAGGSDAPVEDIAVLPGLFAAVTRQDAKGWPEGGWHPEERVTPAEAVDMFSRGAAYAAFEEGDRGAIAIGGRADLTVLDRDPLAVAPADLLRVRVVHTIVGGRVVSSPAAAK
jgi:predicted amidohydrolase YtcJ